MDGVSFDSIAHSLRLPTGAKEVPVRRKPETVLRSPEKNQSKTSPGFTARAKHRAKLSLLDNHFIEGYANGRQFSITRFETIDLKYVGDDIGIGITWQ